MKTIMAWLYRLASPQLFYRLATRLTPWVTGAALVLFAYGLIGGLFLAPPDYQQGDAFRIIYIHVPSAFLSLFVFAFMGFCAFLVLVWRIKLADVMIQASAPLGMMFTALALITGAIWGKPMWGTWWIWDARLTSEFILLFLYLGVIALRQAFQGKPQAQSVVAVFTLISCCDIPLIHYSVNWWQTLHQGATLSRFAKPAIATSMLMPLLAMIGAFIFYFIALALKRAQLEVLRRERRTQWVRALC